LNSRLTSFQGARIEDLCKDLRANFNLSALEVEEFDELERCIVGIAAAMPSHWTEAKANEFMKKVCDYADSHSAIRVVSEDWELFALE
jgi:uncharacterized protein YlxP (DUF503 family)